VYLLKYRQK